MCRHMGLVCPLDCKEELSAGNGSLGDCLAVDRSEGVSRRGGWRGFALASLFFHLSVSRFNQLCDKLSSEIFILTSTFCKVSS